MAQATQKHPFHLVNPSPWPILGAFAGGILAFGAILYMHGKTIWVMLIGLFLVLLTMYVWWRDVVHESVVEKQHTTTVSRGLRVGMGLFIASEVMFFVAFFWAFFSASLFPTEAIEHVWPPKHIKPIDPFDLPFLNTLILLLSGTTVTWAHHSILTKNQKDAVLGLGFTILLGLSFLAIQAYEYIHASFKFDEGIYPSTFYMATGFHGFHVLVGTVFLIVCFFRAWKGHFQPEKHVGFEAAAWYWHFVDVVWLFLFVSIYWWGGK